MNANATTPTRGAKAQADVTALLRARNTLLWIVSGEEVRAERALIEAATTAGYAVRLWDCAFGVSDATGEAVRYRQDDNTGDWLEVAQQAGRSPLGQKVQDPQQVLEVIRTSKARQAWIMRDLPAWLKDPVSVRMVRNLARSLQTATRDAARAVLVLTPSGEVPQDLAGHAMVLDWPLPDRAEVGAILTDVLAALPPEIAKSAAPNGTRDAAIDAAVGLTAEAAASCYAKSLVQTRTIDPAVVAGEKKRVISASRVLEWFDPLAGGLDSVAGLELLKPWLAQRRAALSPAARARGIKAPKGMLLVGVPGCGKSLTAKAVATAWGVPLLKLDLGALKSKWVGESEGNIRRALATAEACAPCVLWLDEIEKALAGSGAGSGGDGGVSADALGAILGWLQERAGSVFVVATANDVRALPPELLRKGRFDEVFWVDLPTTVERRGILQVTAKSEGCAEYLDIDDAGWAEVATACEGFSGAEVASIIGDANLAAYYNDSRVTVADLLYAARAIVPQSKLAGEKLAALRDWAQGRARPASAPEQAASNAGAATARRTLDI